MDFPFEGIPTVPPRKDMDHLAFFCGGCRWVGGVWGCRCGPYAHIPLLTLSTNPPSHQASMPGTGSLLPRLASRAGEAHAPLPTPPSHTPPLPSVYHPTHPRHARYRVTAYPDWPVERVKQALFKGGIARANKPEGVRNTPGIQVGG